MKQTDIDRLKAICEKEGFEITRSREDSIIFHIKKKDPWEGVEFVKIVGGDNVYRVIGVEPSKILVQSYIEGSFINKNDVSKSTEAAYIEQLKKEAFERFGDIKDGDRFDRSKMGFAIKQGIDTIILDKAFTYHKEYDQLQYGNLVLYNSGKWAKKLPERVKVEWLDWYWTSQSMRMHNHEFKVSNLDWDKVQNKDDIGKYLAKCLEEYLNKEAGI